MKNSLLLFLALILATVGLGGCNSVADIVGMNDKAVVIAKRAQIRSSGAVVAADLLEVTRGQTLDVLDETMYEGEKWYNVRAADEENTEGWIEARHVLKQSFLEKSQQIAEADKDTPAQASGQLRAATNLRLSPDMTNSENIMYKLEGGATFDIIGWKRVPKTDVETDKDDATKANASAPANDPKNHRHKDANAPQFLNDKYDTWYKVRLHPSVSPVPAGWLYGKQVELSVPSDIIFYRTGREFVAWSKIDGDTNDSASSFMTRGKDASTREMKPGSWVILEKSNTLQEPNGEEPDFDRILILGYDKIDQTHYRVYRSGNVKGFLPLRVTGTGDSRAFSVRLKDANGEIREIQFGTYKDARGNMKVNVPTDIPKNDKNEN